MIKRIEYLYTLYNNVFEYMPILHSFYKNYVGKEKDMLLSYLVLPIVLRENSRKKLLNTNSRSTLFTFCKDNKYVVGLSEMVRQYKSITNNCIQYGIDYGVFQIMDSLQITINKEFDMINYNQIVDIKSDKIKAARKFANIIKSYDILTTYRYLGVTEL